jgi:hypothetical protein
MHCLQVMMRGASLFFSSFFSSYSIASLLYLGTGLCEGAF